MGNCIICKMNSGARPSCSNSSGNDSQSNNDIVDNSAYTYDLPEDILTSCSHFLDENNAWEEAAGVMGYNLSDIIVSVH